MKMTRERKALIAGIIGCLLFVAGDFLYAAVGKDQSTETFGLMVRAAYLDMAAWRMAASILCGVAGTGLYYVGFTRMYRLLDARLREPRQWKWVKGFRAAYLTGTVCWAYVHAMFMNTALIFKFVYEVYGDVQAAGGHRQPGVCLQCRAHGGGVPPGGRRAFRGPGGDDLEGDAAAENHGGADSGHPL